LGGKKVIRTLFTLTILWVAIAFAWEPFTTTVENTQAVDRTKEIVYNVYDKVKEKVKNE
tara:strand:- start:316 stop:492 length:177 start_codon:yes stop_codon:yes gene_type:complete